MSAETVIQRETRLIMLKELKAQPNLAMTSEAMRRYLLESWLIEKPREWVEEEYAYLRDMKAIEIHEAGSVKIARLSERGEHHLKGLISIPGVLRPSSTGG